MDIREATRDDADAIRSVARNSLTRSYTHVLEEDVIDEAVEQWYGDGLGDDVESEETHYLVAELDGEVVAFSQSERSGEDQELGRIDWLHVDPDHRGDGTGVRLFVRTQEHLHDAGVEQLIGVVLEDNEVGNEFYEAQGFERVDEREIEIGSETYTENVYVEGDLESDAGGWRAMQEVEVDGDRLFVSYGEAVRGSEAPFYTTYRDEEGGRRYGWFCGNCDSFDNAMDSMGRIECNVCGNLRKATRWDASYL